VYEKTAVLILILFVSIAVTAQTKSDLSIRVDSIIKMY